ncbi:hypothetical protein FGIG_07004 [Fasciola gigantica]|uniref:Uncharacterized protein n=1 Tax=Fasciola gigantica TaxID=46835 RepID=A0A504Z177_FASGI|nr:hypothetical protein FGIG_07004 [Fasciola gigantica]
MTRTIGTKQTGTLTLLPNNLPDVHICLR